MKKALYEVNLAVDPDIWSDYLAWLRPHIQEVLALPGFEGAEMHRWMERSEEGWIQVTVFYTLESGPALQDYLMMYAPAMRADGMERFHGKFRAWRRTGHPMAIATT